MSMIRKSMSKVSASKHIKASMCMFSVSVCMFSASLVIVGHPFVCLNHTTY